MSYGKIVQECFEKSDKKSEHQLPSNFGQFESVPDLPIPISNRKNQLLGLSIIKNLNYKTVQTVVLSHF